MNGVKNDSGVFRKLVCFTALRRPGLQIQLQHLHGAIYVLPRPNPHPTPQVGWMSFQLIFFNLYILPFLKMRSWPKLSPCPIPALARLPTGLMGIFVTTCPTA